VFVGFWGGSFTLPQAFHFYFYLYFASWKNK
jgi:hypothetical protein